MPEYEYIDYIAFIRTGVLNIPILDRALDQVYTDECELSELRDALEEGLETAIKNNREFLKIDFHSGYLREILNDLEAGREADIYGIHIPAEAPAEAEVESEEVLEPALVGV